MMTENEQQKIAELQQILDEHGINGKAAALLETMETRGIVGPLADNGKREILADDPGKETENQAE